MAKTAKDILISLKGKVRCSFQFFFLGQCGKFCHLRAHPAHQGGLLHVTPATVTICFCAQKVKWRRFVGMHNEPHTARKQAIRKYTFRKLVITNNADQTDNDRKAGARLRRRVCAWVRKTISSTSVSKMAAGFCAADAEKRSSHSPLSSSGIYQSNYKRINIREKKYPKKRAEQAARPERAGFMRARFDSSFLFF